MKPMRNLDEHTVDVRDSKDLRLPGSLLTAKEHRELCKIAEECNAERERIGRKHSRIVMADKRHPYYPVYEYLTKIMRRHEEAGEPARCPLCGKLLSEEEQPIKEYKSCMCMSCKNKLCTHGRISGIDNTRGYKNWQQTCIICRTRMAAPNHGGMCLACYRLGERYGVKNVEQLRDIRHLVNYKSNVIIGKAPVAKGLWFVRRTWVRDKLSEDDANNS